MITILKIHQSKFGFLIWVLDYIFFKYYQKLVLIFYLKLSTFNVNLRLAEYQVITFRY